MRHTKLNRKLVVLVGIALAVPSSGLSASAALEGLIVYSPYRSGADAEGLGIHVMSPTGRGVRTLTSRSGDSVPQLSPGGNVVAFENIDDDGFASLRAVNVDGSDDRLVADLNQGFADFSWAPNGSRLAFVGDPDGDGTTDLYTVAPDGSGLDQVTSDDAIESNPAWSPDGGRLAFARYGADGSGEGVFAIAADGTGEQQLTSAGSYAQTTWSPDGSRVAFISFDDSGRSDIGIVGADGGNQKELTSDCRIEIDLNWLPNSKAIVFTTLDDLCKRKKDGEIKKVTVRGKVTNITDDRRDDGAPALSPDGTWIVFQSAGRLKDRDFDLFRIKLDGSKRKRLTDNGARFQDVLPDW